MRLTALLLITCGVTAQLAAGAVYNATPANYTTLLAGLQPGDTLNLAAGNYPFLNIVGLNGTPSAWITITGPASGAPAVIYATSTCCNTVEITNSSYLAITNLTIDSRSQADVDGVSAHGGTGNLTHDIRIEGNTFVGQDSDQQCVAISTKTPTWNWIIRRNVITGAGTGLYLGDSDGTSPFVAGLIEDNLVQNTIGYNMEIKFQQPRPTVAGMPTGQSFTIIRNNVFIKNDQPSPDGDRPNLYLGGFPDSGPGSTDMYEVYGNFLDHNPREALLQAEGRVSVHDNVFVDGQYAAAVFESNNLALKVAYVYNNTVYSSAAGIQFGSTATIDDAVVGNLVFAGNPISGSIAHSANNMVDTLTNASAYVNAPSFTLGSMDFFPQAGKAQGAALDLTKFAGDVDYTIDFNGTPKNAAKQAIVFRGAYAGEGANPGWKLQAGIKTVGMVSSSAALGSLQCVSSSVTAGQTDSCSVFLVSAVSVNTTISITSSNSSFLIAPSSVTIPANSTVMAFSVTGGSVSGSQNATLSASLNGVTKSVSLTVNQQLGVVSVTCPSTTLTAGSSENCTVTLSAAPAAATVVALMSGVPAIVSVPASVTIAAGQVSATFAATAANPSSNQNATIAASLNGTAAGITLTVQAQATSSGSAAFYLHGNSSEILALTNGSRVLPTAGPSGLAGSLVVRGAGSAAFSPVFNGNGVVLAQGGQQNSNTAFVSFTGMPVSSIFSAAQGDMTFYVKSSYSFAARQVLPATNFRWVFGVDDGTNELFYFLVYTSGGRLTLAYRTGSTMTTTYYTVPAGQEDQLFGQGVTAKFRLTWNGSTNTLYWNDAPVETSAYTAGQPNWTASSSFVIGARSAVVYGGGFYTCDDAIGEFQVQGAGGGAPPPAGSPAVTLGTGTLTFGTQTVGSAGTPQPVTLTNSGTAALTITSVAVTGTNAGDFTETTTCGASLAAGQNCSVSVTFKPTAAGARSAAVTIADNATGSPHSVTLTGTGQAAQTGGSGAFYLHGNSSEVAGLSNGSPVTPASAPAGFTGSVVVRGAGSTTFSPVVNGNGLVFAQGGQQNTSTGFLSFSGTGVGNIFGTAQGDMTFYVKSSYSFAARQALPATNFRWVFGVDDGVNELFYFTFFTSGGRLIAVYRTASSVSNSYYYVPAGQEDQLFGQGVVAKLRLTWNGSTNTLYWNDNVVAITPYTPTASTWGAASSFVIGARSAVIYGGGFYTCDDAIAEFQVQGAGGGSTSQGTSGVTLNPGSLTFASQTVGTSAAPQGVTLSNSGTAALSITSIAVTGTNPGDFTQTNNCGASLPAGQSCSISVTFKPSAAGSRGAAVTITDNAAASPQSITLTGTGAAAQGSGAVFYLHGNSSEIASLTNGAAVTPTSAPAGLASRLVVRGAGSAAFSPVVSGNGVVFSQGGQQNSNTGFLSFSGPQVASIFNPNQGDMTFYVKSSYSFAARQALPGSNFRWVFGVDDGSNELFYFIAFTSGGRLILVYRTGSTTSNSYYYVPVGQEDQLFGQGVVAKFRLTWNGSTNTLYWNDVPVATTGYVPSVPSWSAASSFVIGARSAVVYGGGYYTCDDAVAEFQTH